MFADLERLDEQPRSPRGLPLSADQAAALACPFELSATISAGAGSGKTRVLVERAAQLVAAGANPARIAVVTFTRKAAREIGHRLETRFGDKKRVPVCTTVHALALSLLTRQGITVQVADESQLLALVAQLRPELPDEFQDYSDAELMLEINRCREEEQYLSLSGLVSLRFEEMLALAGLTDFTSLLAVAAKAVKGTFEYVLVDESQDLSQLQQAFLRAIGAPKARYWFIGDADQAIYAFRGAHEGVMQELRDASDKQYVLQTNYRSARAIVRHANNVIRGNVGRLDIEWEAHSTDEGRIAVEPCENADDELNRVTQWLKSDPSRTALGRTQALIAPLREQGLSAFTVHESKGLEWQEVWIMGCEAAMFPHPLCARDEERRLFYVAMTRAKQSLTMSYCRTRSSKAAGGATRHPSCFLFETQAL